MSLARLNTNKMLANKKGNHSPIEAAHFAVCFPPDANSPDAKIDAVTTPVRNQMTSSGTTWTNATVFKVARELLLEVIPIHNPNQTRARRLAAVVAVATAPEAIVITRPCPIMTPLELVE